MTREQANEVSLHKSWKRYIRTGLLFISGVDMKIVAGFGKDQEEFMAYKAALRAGLKG